MTWTGIVMPVLPEIVIVVCQVGVVGIHHRLIGMGRIVMPGMEEMRGMDTILGVDLVWGGIVVGCRRGESMVVGEMVGGGSR